MCPGGRRSGTLSAPASGCCLCPACGELVWGSLFPGEAPGSPSISPPGFVHPSRLLRSVLSLACDSFHPPVQLNLSAGRSQESKGAPFPRNARGGEGVPQAGLPRCHCKAARAEAAGEVGTGTAGSHAECLSGWALLSQLPHSQGLREAVQTRTEPTPSGWSRLPLQFLIFIPG